MSKHDGGSAFPLPHHTRNYDYNKCEHIQDDGMTLRDYFAAKAMQSIFPLPEYHGGSNDRIAAVSYSMADAMLKARGL
jgi:hypothetical protein